MKEEGALETSKRGRRNPSIQARPVRSATIKTEGAISKYEISAISAVELGRSDPEEIEEEGAIAIRRSRRYGPRTSKRKARSLAPVQEDATGRCEQGSCEWSRRTGKERCIGPRQAGATGLGEGDGATSWSKISRCDPDYR